MPVHCLCCEFPLIWVEAFFFLPPQIEAIFITSTHGWWSRAFTRNQPLKPGIVFPLSYQYALCFFFLSAPASGPNVQEFSPSCPPQQEDAPAHSAGAVVQGSQLYHLSWCRKETCARDEWEEGHKHEVTFLLHWYQSQCCGWWARALAGTDWQSPASFSSALHKQLKIMSIILVY